MRDESGRKINHDHKTTKTNKSKKQLTSRVLEKQVLPLHAVEKNETEKISVLLKMSVLRVYVVKESDFLA